MNGIHIYSGIQTQSLLFETSQGLSSPVDLPLNFLLVSSLLLPLQLLIGLPVFGLCIQVQPSHY